MTTVTLVCKNTFHRYRAVKWCEQNVGQHGRGWLGSYDKSRNPIFRFDRESDAVMFKLRWA